jgi:hypothetical protein
MQVHKTTVWRHMAKRMKALVAFKVAASHPVINEATRKKRLLWATKKRQDGWCWTRTVFIDEATFKLGGLARPRKVWMVRGKEPFKPKLHQGGKSLHTIIAFSASPTLPTKIAFCTKWTAQVYKDFLQKHITKGRRDPVIIMHDNAPVHTAKIVKAFAREKLVIDTQQPPYSPDTQPVEDVISWLKRKVYGGNRVFTSPAELQVAVTAAFAEFSSDGAFKKNLAKSMPKRLDRIIKAKGNWP